MSARRARELYEEDFYAWTQLQAWQLRRLARANPRPGLDLPHIFEEIRDLGREERAKVRGWVRRILEHLLRVEYVGSVEDRRRVVDELFGFRDEIGERLTPTLRRDLERRLPRLYEEARHDLAQRLRIHGETEALERVPEDCPYSLDQILGDFWPDEAQAR